MQDPAAASLRVADVLNAGHAPAQQSLHDGDIVVICPRCATTWSLGECEVREEPQRTVYRCPSDRALFVIVWRGADGELGPIEKRVTLFYDEA